VIGPRGEREIVEITDGPPSEEAEAELVVRWVTGLLAAVREVADDDTVYLHIYVYDTTTRRSCSRRSGGTSTGSPGYRTSSIS
jgi:hypothetical protein